MAVEIDRLDEETRSLLRRVIERQAWRQLMTANIRGHALRFVPELEEKIALVDDLHASLGALREVQRVYGRLGGGDLALALRGKMEGLPYPTSRMELAVALLLCDRAERIVARGYAACVCGDFAAVARTLLAQDRGGTRRGEELFRDYCAEPGNRPHAQAVFNRWLSLCLRSLGRPGTAGDARAVALRLRERSCDDWVREYLEELRPLLEACGLEMPTEEVLAVELPAARPARPAPRSRPA